MAEWWQDPAFLTQLSALVGILATIFGALVLFWRWARAHDRLHAKLESLPDDVADLRLKVSVLVIEAVRRDSTLFDQLKALGMKGGNPYDPDRRNALLDKMRAGTLNFEEAQELQRYLQEDAARLTAQRDPSATAVLSGLGTAASFVYLLGGQACEVNRAFEFAFPDKFRSVGLHFEPGAHGGDIRVIALNSPAPDGSIRMGAKTFLLCERHIAALKQYDARYREQYRAAQSAFLHEEWHD